MGHETFPYKRIASEIRQLIQNGELARGAQLLSEAELSRQYEASRPTVRRAIAMLKAEGLLITEQGRGAFVRNKPVVKIEMAGNSYHSRRLSSFRQQVEALGFKSQERLMSAEQIIPPEYAAARLKIPAGEKVVVRRVLYLIDNEPVAFDLGYYPSRFAAGTALENNQLIPAGSGTVIEDPEGTIRLKYAHVVDTLEARMPTMNETMILHLPAGVPIMEIMSTDYDIIGEPIDLHHTVAVADRHQFQYSRQRAAKDAK